MDGEAPSTTTYEYDQLDAKGRASVAGERDGMDVGGKATQGAVAGCAGATGNRTAMISGGVRNEYAYDRRHRLSSLIKRTAAGALLLAMNYSVDASGMRTGVGG